jgi:hypothetical protein
MTTAFTWPFFSSAPSSTLPTARRRPCFRTSWKPPSPPISPWPATRGSTWTSSSWRPYWRGFPGSWRPTSPQGIAPRQTLPPLYPMDTTGLAYRREDRFLRFRRGAEVRRVRGHARLLALVRWERERRLLLPWGGVAGRGYAPDPQLGGKALLRFAPTGGWLLADAGFDGKEVWEALRGEGLRLVIRLRGGGEAREEARVRAREGWDPEVYRFRGVVEGVFGGMKRRLGGPTFGSGSLGRPWCGRFWSSSPTALGSFSPFFRRPLGTRRFTRQAPVGLTE